ncbi:hypothetical protein B0T16DRAFT_69531 [Cercophora newfieldiana]|uniref:Apple domain-containing protein n=1 Tax=Cercophora newfieldiana TaxID=92897 RepID=A0AA39YSN9_9PEZI|nr:hypothetical protein B0T16DRAFT_69531 [Cercophora newfieldiana]
MRLSFSAAATDAQKPRRPISFQPRPTPPNEGGFRVKTICRFLYRLNDMRPARIFGGVVVGLLPLAAALRPNLNFPSVCSVDGVLRYFTCSRNVSPVCAVELAEQAVEFCRDFLAVEPVTVTLTTVTPVDSSTIIETSTTSTTTTIETTTTELTTTLTTETSTLLTISTTFVNPPLTEKKKRTATAACPSIVSKNLLHHPASRLSRACSCLSVTPTTSTVTIPAATAPTTTVLATSTTIETLIFSSTEVSTATSIETLVSSTTTTTTAVATFTLPPQCVDPPLSGIFPAGTGNQFQSEVIVSSVQECCALCYDTLNCVGAGYASDGRTCNLLLKVQPQAGTGSSDQCPLGFDSTNSISSPVPGAVEGAFLGPCKPV